MAAIKRPAEMDSLVEAELTKLCREVKCDVCVVPLAGKEVAIKHYGGKIHAKKVERWKESWIAQKKIKLENESQRLPDIQYKDDIYTEQTRVKEVKRQEPGVDQQKRSVYPDEKQHVKDEQLPAMTMPLDPRLIDSMDPATMKRMLSGKPLSRWDTPEDNVCDDVTDDSYDDPDDTTIPIDSGRLQKKCFNPMTGIGYCQYCNKLLRSAEAARKHFSSAKHAGKVLTYQELILSEAAILAGSAIAAPPPHRGHYCELCESDCSGQTQLDQHLRGERHRTNVRKMEKELVGDPELDKDINPYNLPEVWMRERKHCNLCDVPIFSIRMAKIHFNSRNHRQAAGLNMSRASRESSELVSTGKVRCEVCNFKTETEIDMKVHTAGIRHLENERTKAAVESTGGEWKVCIPSPPDPPKNSVQSPPQGEASGMPMMGWGGGWGWGGPMMPPSGMPGAMMNPHVMGQQGFPPMGYPGMGSAQDHGNMPGAEVFYCSICQLQFENHEQIEQHMQTDEHQLAEANTETLSCKMCSVSFTSSQDLAQHQASPSHARNAGLKMERDRLRQAGHDLPDSDQEEAGEEEDFLPEPLPENASNVRTKSNPFHCPVCNVWVPTVTLLRFYHSAKDDHKEEISKQNQQENTEYSCSSCKISASTVEELWEACLAKQKHSIYGAHRQYSCEMCDVHLSEQDWLDNHKMGEKHRWIAERVEKLLPVQFVPQEMFVVQKSEYNPYTCMFNYYPEFQCTVCKVGFSPIDKYKKHLGSLFHLRKSAGEDVHWVEGGGYQF